MPPPWTSLSPRPNQDSAVSRVVVHGILVTIAPSRPLSPQADKRNGVSLLLAVKRSLDARANPSAKGKTEVPVQQASLAFPNPILVTMNHVELNARHSYCHPSGLNFFSSDVVDPAAGIIIEPELGHILGLRLRLCILILLLPRCR